MHNRSKFSWSFSGYETQAIAEKELENMLTWFNTTFKPNEWEVKTTVGAGVAGFVASMIAQREVQDG